MGSATGVDEGLVVTDGVALTVAAGATATGVCFGAAASASPGAATVAGASAGTPSMTGLSAETTPLTGCPGTGAYPFGAGSCTGAGAAGTYTGAGAGAYTGAGTRAGGTYGAGAGTYGAGCPGAPPPPDTIPPAWPGTVDPPLPVETLPPPGVPPVALTEQNWAPLAATATT